MAQTAVADTVSLFQVETVVLGDGSQGPFRLPDALIIPGTEVVELEGSSLRPGLDYQLDAVRGEIRLTRPLAQGQVLRLRYEKFPYDLRPSYSRRPIRFLTPGEDPVESAVAPARPRRPDAAEPAQLTVAGNKTFSVELGSNRDATLKQALNLQIGGFLARDVEVRAILSDTDIPLQPEGTTQELEQLDNVLVEVRSTHLSATLGDYDVAIRNRRFASLQRQLEGALGVADYDRWRVAVAGAVSKGKHASMEFRGEEGRQGPYMLLSREGGRDIVVVAGSERVTIFGERMVRGENNDYTIDYQDGTLQFTNKRLITQDAEIAVDYEYMTEDYKRGFYFGETELRDLADGRLDLALSVFSERDQTSRPLAEDLTSEDRDVLAASGDEDAWVSGATDVGEGNGPYGRVEVPSGESYFVWVGPDSGRYNVRFTELPDSSGQYTRRFDDSAGRYVYEFTGHGPYVPLIRIPAPQAQTLADLKWNLDAGEQWSFSGEAALSDVDRNTLSDLDDGNNLGGVYEVELALNRRPVSLGKRSLGRVTLRGMARSREERFQPLGRTEIPYYGKRWNLYSVSEQRAEDVREANLAYEPWKGGDIRLNYGRLNQQDDITSIRKDVTATQDLGGGSRISSLYEKVDSWDKRPGGDSRRKTRVFRSDASIRWGKVLTGAVFERDARDRGSPDSLLWGLRYDDVQVSASLVEMEKWTGSVRAAQRETDEVSEGDWAPHSVSRTTEVAVRRQGAGSFSAGAILAHRRLAYDSRLQEADLTTDLADLDLNHSLFGDRLSNRFNYRISNATRTLRERHFVWVGEGADYDSSGNFIDGEGFYEPVTVPGGSRPVTEVVASARLRWNPTRRAALTSGEGAWFDRFSSETFIKIDEKTTSDDRARIYLLDPGVLRDDQTTLEGRLTFRQDLLLFPRRPTFSVRFRYEYNDFTDNRLEGVFRDVVEGQRSILLRSSPREGLGLELEYLNRWRGEDVEEGGAVRAEDRFSHGVRMQVSQWIGGRTKLVLRTAFDSTEERESARAVRSLEVAPAVTYSFLGKGRAEGAMTWRRASGDIETGPFSRIGYLGRPGWDWRLRADYRVGRYVTASLTYSGNREEGRDAIHSGKTELRAYF